METKIIDWKAPKTGVIERYVYGEPVIRWHSCKTELLTKHKKAEKFYGKKRYEIIK